ncbi:hypothetical protein O3G_MSEX010106 [Manduca sexta]|uniref:FAR1 domain-containing protein n=3 Tax=Manduca sexta TaxID=7130 RepID=A0A921ZG25_MANSE|nr:hypothetical protein O3G_MSEX010106 [Manduca sexta]
MSFNLSEKESKMGFIDYFNQDHCYLEDRQDTNPEQIQSNMEITKSYDQMETCNSSSTKQGNENAHIIMKCQEKDQRSTKTGSQQIIYLPPVGYCTEHEDLLLHEDQRLVKPGDKFKTHNDFVQYLNENAKRWFYYYKCSDSRKPNTDQEMYLYNCVYLRNKEKYVKKGLRKRNNSIKTNCPCKIKLRHLPYENELTVIFVCNHHDHPLSEEAFYKLQHGRRLPPYVKEEIMDLLTLQVDMGKIRKYVQNATGFNMSRAFFYTMERTMKSRNVDRQISDERFRTLSKRLSENNIILDSMDSKRLKTNNFEDNVNNETDTLQSMNNLQEYTKCETQHNPWVTDQCVPVLPNGDLTITNKNDDIMSGVESHNSDIKDNIEIIVNDRAECECDVNKTFETDEDCSVAYETFVSETDIEYDENVISEYIYDDAEYCNDPIEKTNNENTVKDTNEAINCKYENDAEIVEYFTDNENESIHNCKEDYKNNTNRSYCDEEIVEYEVDFDNDYIEAKDAEVQTCDININKLNPLISVFDVCMKGGNVTGFVVNNEVMKQLKNDRVEKGVQTEEINNSDMTQAEDAIDEAKDYAEMTSDGKYIKHEYIHTYNIDKYMCRPCFPKYIEVLSKKTGIDVLEMFTNVYNERAMFKMTTTQSDKEGNTRILYVKNPDKITLNLEMKKRRELDNCLKEILVLKEKVKELEMKNLKLETINKQLMTSLR